MGIIKITDTATYTKNFIIAKNNNASIELDFGTSKDNKEIVSIDSIDSARLGTLFTVRAKITSPNPIYFRNDTLTWEFIDSQGNLNPEAFSIVSETVTSNYSDDLYTYYIIHRVKSVFTGSYTLRATFSDFINKEVIPDDKKAEVQLSVKDVALKSDSDLQLLVDINNSSKASCRLKLIYPNDGYKKPAKLKYTYNSSVNELVISSSDGYISSLSYYSENNKFDDKHNFDLIDIQVSKYGVYSLSFICENIFGDSFASSPVSLTMTDNVKRIYASESSVVLCHSSPSCCTKVIKIYAERNSGKCFRISDWFIESIVDGQNCEATKSGESLIINSVRNDGYSDIKIRYSANTDLYTTIAVTTQLEGVFSGVELWDYSGKLSNDPCSNYRYPVRIVPCFSPWDATECGPAPTWELRTEGTNIIKLEDDWSNEVGNYAGVFEQDDNGEYVPTIVHIYIRNSTGTNTLHVNAGSYENYLTITKNHKCTDATCDLPDYSGDSGSGSGSSGSGSSSGGGSSGSGSGGSGSGNGDSGSSGNKVNTTVALRFPESAIGQHNNVSVKCGNKQFYYESSSGGYLYYDTAFSSETAFYNFCNSPQNVVITCYDYMYDDGVLDSTFTTIYSASNVKFKYTPSSYAVYGAEATVGSFTVSYL